MGNLSQSDMLLQYAGLVFLLSCSQPSAGGGATNDGEKAMQQLETAEVKLEQKLASMMSELGTQLKQAEETQLPLKRKKRQAKKSEEDVDVAEPPPPPPPKGAGVNPMAKYSLEDFVGVLKSMRQLRKAFDNLMESYRVYKNNQEEEQADKVKADIGDEDEENDEDEEKDDEKDEDEEGDDSEEDDEDEVDKEDGDDSGDDEDQADKEDSYELDDEGKPIIDEGTEPSETKEEQIVDRDDQENNNDGNAVESIDDRRRRMKRMRRHRR